MENQFFIKIRQDRRGVVKGVELQFPVFEASKNGKYFAESPILKAIGYSNNNAQEAAEDLKKDIKLFILYHIKNNSLQSSLKLFGWRNHGYNSNKFEAPVVSIEKYKSAKTSKDSFDVAA